MANKQSGSAHLVVIIILIVALVGALGFIFWQNFISNAQKGTGNTDTSKVAEEVKDDSNKDAPEQKGTITGSLTYPSEYIPPSMEVHAVNLATNKEYTTKDHLKGTEYQYGTGYRIEVPVGHYNVYGTLPDWPNFKAYYNQVIVCGIRVECTDTTKIDVLVEANKDTTDVTIGDWWTPQE